MLTTQKAAPAQPPEVDLWDIRAVCSYFGGNRPLSPSTIYRGIATGIYPAAVRVGPNIARWIPDECRAARAAMIGARTAAKEAA